MQSSLITEEVLPKEPIQDSVQESALDVFKELINNAINDHKTDVIKTHLFRSLYRTIEAFIKAVQQALNIETPSITEVMNFIVSDILCYDTHHQTLLMILARSNEGIYLLSQNNFNLLKVLTEKTVNLTETEQTKKKCHF